MGRDAPEKAFPWPLNERRFPRGEAVTDDDRAAARPYDKASDKLTSD